MNLQSRLTFILINHDVELVTEVALAQISWTESA